MRRLPTAQQHAAADAWDVVTSLRETLEKLDALADDLPSSCRAYNDTVHAYNRALATAKEIQQLADDGSGVYNAFHG